MDQLSETYKKNIQYMSLLIGIFLAVLLNVDSLFVANTLWNDPALREALVQTAQTQIESGQLEQTITQSQEALQQAQNNAEATPEPTVPLTEGSGVDTDTPSATEQVQDSIQDLLALRLPIGWEFTTLTSDCAPTIAGNPCDDVRNLWNLGPANNAAWFGILLRKLVGWAITVIAISQGAPFWFDLLNRIARGKSS
jgi:hypothetical protein